MTIHLKDIISFSKKSLSCKKKNKYTQIHGRIFFFLNNFFSAVKNYNIFNFDRYVRLHQKRIRSAGSRSSNRYYDGENESRPCRYGQIRSLLRRWAAWWKMDRLLQDRQGYIWHGSLSMPSLVCRAIDGDGPHNRATSRQTTEVMASFKLKMGISNYAILNALRKRKEMMATVQQG